MRLILAKKKKAQSLIEYALILAMVAVVAIACIKRRGKHGWSGCRKRRA